MDSFNPVFAPPPPPPPVQPHVILPRVRQSRISRSCDRCHVRSTKCQPRQDGSGGCQNCLEYGVPCTYDRPAKRRGMKPKSHPLLSGARGNPLRDGEANDPTLRVGESDARMLLELTNGPQGNGNLISVNNAPNFQRWKGMAVANQPQIKDLVELYIELLYPMNPFFHIPTLRRRVESRDYLTDQPFFAEIMSICALSAAKALDESLVKRWPPNHFRASTSSTFHAAIEEVMPTELEELRTLEWIRTCAMMTLYGLQIDKFNVFHKYMGIYLSIVAMDGIQDEENWPKDSGIIEIEMRRRLFWTMYSLEVYTSVIFGNSIRIRENRTNVQYPSEVDDDFFSDAGYHPPKSLTPFVTSQPIIDSMCWMHGWNFDIGLYRILEDCISKAPCMKSTNRFSLAESPKINKEYEKKVPEAVISTFESLDTRFKSSRRFAIEENGEFPDRFDLQAAKIMTTLQLIRMVLFNSGSARDNEKIAMAGDILGTMAQLPTPTLKIIATPQLYHLGGIAGILKSAMQSPISDIQCRLIRQLWTLLLEIFNRMEHELMTDSNLSKSVRDQIEKMTEHIENPENQIPHLLLSGSISSSDDTNVDPSLQSSDARTTNLTSTRDPLATISDQFAILGAIGADADAKSLEFGTDHLEGSDDIYFQLPAEVVNGWPWFFDVSNGFGGSRN